VFRSATVLKMPSFRNNQRVKFSSGEGIVRKFQYELGSWDYLIEIEAGQYPDFGRVGAETMVILREAELCPAESTSRGVTMC
jgi:hypothetical protein